MMFSEGGGLGKHGWGGELKMSFGGWCGGQGGKKKLVHSSYLSLSLSMHRLRTHSIYYFFFVNARFKDFLVLNRRAGHNGNPNSVN